MSLRNGLIGSWLAGTLVVLGCSGCSKPKDPVERMLAHSREMIALLKDHQDNCQKAVEALQSYVQKHESEWKELSQRSGLQESKLSAEDKKKYDLQAVDKVKTFLEDTLPSRMELEKKCPGQLTQLGDSFGKALKTFQ